VFIVKTSILDHPLIIPQVLVNCIFIFIWFYLLLNYPQFLSWSNVYEKVCCSRTGGGVGQVIEHFPSKHKALSSTLVPPKIKNCIVQAPCVCIFSVVSLLNDLLPFPLLTNLLEICFARYKYSFSRCFQISFAWNIIFYTFSFSLYVYLSVMWVSCKHETDLVF
jgi:hypothetical protein